MNKPPPASRTLWHASRANISRPTIAGRTEGDNHENSGLGIFCATEPADYIAGFGSTVHEITLHHSVRVMRLKIKELAAMGRVSGEPQRTRQWFETEGRRWGKDYDVVELVEMDGQVAQAIILNDDAIAACTARPVEAFLAGLAQPRRPRPNR